MKIAVLPGDGIGPEIVAQAVKVLEALRADGAKIETETAPIGGAGYDAAGDPGVALPPPQPNPESVLTSPRYRGASVLLARDNFGCGSSREHAPWALEDYGIRAIIAPSYADIFYNNCFKNGILPIMLDATVVDRLFRECEASEGYRLNVDLDKQTVTTPGSEVLAFEVDGGRKHRLVNGLDDI